jgi:putative component of membrane protein insertase Oxa1/YidC/SpoIIIJ protein YidD
LSAIDFDDMIRKNFAFFIILSLCFAPLLCCASGAQGNDNFTPWDFATREMKSADAKTELSLPATLLKGGFIIFSKYISPIDGDRCNMYPTCAAYSREAVEKHGFIGGLLLTVDRLIHESNEIDTAPRIVKWDRLRFLDPVSNNDFWWHTHP